MVPQAYAEPARLARSPLGSGIRGVSPGNQTALPTSPTAAVHGADPPRGASRGRLRDRDVQRRAPATGSRAHEALGHSFPSGRAVLRRRDSRGPRRRTRSAALPTVRQPEAAAREQECLREPGESASNSLLAPGVRRRRRVGRPRRLRRVDLRRAVPDAARRCCARARRAGSVRPDAAPHVMPTTAQASLILAAPGARDVVPPR